ncbi:MAG: fold metallo-hydrolase, partial [Gammaproteobacteria bacterium]|nr:fold metallo-hydrolase [Gammaproteobacteria bacterium]
ISGLMLQMATGESVAHLNCLIQRGQVMRRMDDAGVAWYQATASARSLGAGALITP